MQEYLLKHNVPRVLEIGLDHGITTIPLMSKLITHKLNYTYVGIDIRIREHLKLTLGYMGGLNEKAAFIEDNSLNVLPKLVENKNLKFDLILVDGDHNYSTVIKELESVEQLISDKGIIIIDDYHGRWAEKDLWYANRPGYEDNDLATKPEETEKAGVATAVNDWLEKSDKWKTAAPIKGEPILIFKKEARYEF